jgi:ribosomal protein L44E
MKTSTNRSERENEIQGRESLMDRRLDAGERQARRSVQENGSQTWMKPGSQQKGNKKKMGLASPAPL